jgi:putative endonuclease
VYFEEFERIDEAFEREKQIQRWSRKKKEALIKGDIKGLKRASECKNETHFQRTKAKSEHKTERSRGLKQTSEDLGP